RAGHPCTGAYGGWAVGAAVAGLRRVDVAPAALRRELRQLVAPGIECEQLVPEVGVLSRGVAVEDEVDEAAARVGGAGEDVRVLALALRAVREGGARISVVG